MTTPETTSSDRLAEARDRLRRLYADEPYRDVYGVEPTGCGLQQKDERLLIEWCLAQPLPAAPAGGDDGVAPLTMLQKAEWLAHLSHDGQIRKYNSRPYIEHPMRVAHAAMMHGLGDHAVAAAWLHDVLEDCEVEPGTIKNHCGATVLALVMELTNPSKGSKEPRGKRKALDRKHIAGASREARVLKLLDRLDNIREMTGCDPDFWTVYAGETRQLCDALDCDDALIAGLLVELRAAIEPAALAPLPAPAAGEADTRRLDAVLSGRVEIEYMGTTKPYLNFNGHKRSTTTADGTDPRAALDAAMADAPTPPPAAAAGERIEAIQQETNK